MTRTDRPSGPPYRVGDLARLARTSVRALHHYEELGLLVPSARTEAGHRLYSAADVERLGRIKALAALGFSLEEIRGCLDGEAWSPMRLIETHLARARELLEEQHDLCQRLERLRESVRQAPEDAGHFIEIVEVMSMVESYYTAEQLEALKARRAEIGEDAIRQVERDWQDLFTAVKAELARGTRPGDPAAQALARRWQALTQRTVAGFTGGDPAIKANLDRLYAEQPVDRIHPGFDPAVFAFMREACERLER